MKAPNVGLGRNCSYQCLPHKMTRCSRLKNAMTQTNLEL